MPSQKPEKKPKAKVVKTSQSTSRARTPERREKELINLAMDLAEKQMKDGSATSQVITHFLKLGSETEKLAREKLKAENKLIQAKVSQIEAQKKIEELYEEAIIVMKRYSGMDDPFHDEEHYDDL